MTFLWWCRRFHHHRRARNRHGKLELYCDKCERAFPIRLTDPKRALRLRRRMQRPANIVSMEARLEERRKSS